MSYDFNSAPQPIPTENVPVKKEKKNKKKKEVNEDVEEMALALFIYWKSKDLMRTGTYQYEEASEKAELMWKDETDDTTLELFRKAAAVQIVMLGGLYVAPKKRKQARSDLERNRAECNPFLLYCKDHRENVREKGSRGKGMTTLSNMWKALPENEKEKYQELAKQNKSKEKEKLAEAQNSNLHDVNPPLVNHSNPSLNHFNNLSNPPLNQDMSHMHTYAPPPINSPMNGGL
ncbi:HMG box domain-containing protein [Entamoeba marina]